MRRPRPDDRPGLATLATALWGPDSAGLFADRWWWNDDQPHCWIAEHRPSGAVAAVCAQRRTRVVLAGRTEAAATVSDWYVAPGHTGAGLGQALVRKGEEASPFMYTSAISEAAAQGFRRLGWIGDRRVPMSAGLVRLAFLRAGRPVAGLDIECLPVSSEDSGDLSAVDDLWDELSWPSASMMVRDADFLRGHLALAGGRPYSLLIARRAGQVVGYLLFRTLPRRALRSFGPVRVGIVSDYLVDRDDAATLRDLVGEACRRWSRQRVAVMLAMTATPRHQAALSGLGLIHPVTVGGQMIGRRMSSRCMHQVGVGAEGNWHLTFADNDTDLILGAHP